jgi:tRNA threonylcarbamoyladenosine biosynthesis protein TsaE
MATFISRSPEDTERLGEAWGREAQAGWVIGLIGELGAGKTRLVQGLARGLGVKERVTSPTFTLVQEYASGRQPLFHLDLYRLETRQAMIAAGLGEYLHRPAGVAVVEWADKWFDAEPRREAQNEPRRGALRLVHIECTGEHERHIRYDDFGP